MKKIQEELLPILTRKLEEVKDKLEKYEKEKPQPIFHEAL